VPGSQQGNVRLMMENSQQTDAPAAETKRTAELGTMAIADVLAEQVKHIDSDVNQVDEANLPGSPDEWEWAADAMNRVLNAVPTTPAVHLSSATTAGRRSRRATGAS
jgi:methionine synthase II (cobalamin-independent)